MSHAQRRLEELCVEVLQKQSPQTLAYFRLSNLDIRAVLENFAAGHNVKTPLLDQVLVLFRRLNQHMAEQEITFIPWADFLVLSSDPIIPLSKREISVVFGGKYSRNPASISEQLVSKLVPKSKTVYTVSRTCVLKEDLPDNVLHIPKQNLDVGGGDLVEALNTTPGSVDSLSQGAKEFYDVLIVARDEWLKEIESQAKQSTITTLTLYFTLGQHKGVNPFIRNLTAAQNFHLALQTIQLPSDKPWRVVLTGTDATLPSTHSPSHFVMKENTVLEVPTYKIAKNNYVYAMSKLGQYALIANSILRLYDGENKSAIQETADMFEKIQKHVVDAGDDGNYHEDTDPRDPKRISMEDLDKISIKLQNNILKPLFDQKKLWIAPRISICYTPLHAQPWTEAAVQYAKSSKDRHDYSSNEDLILYELQKTFILEQIVKRLKNAISIESAATLHFPNEMMHHRP